MASINDGKKYVFDFVIEKQDYRRSVICINFGSRRWKRICLLVAWIAATIAFVLNLLKIISLSAPMYACCFMVMIVLGMAWVTAMISIYKYKKVYDKGKGVKRRITFEDFGITFTNLTNNDHGTTPWEEVHGIQELEDSYIIRVGNTDAVILPKRAILLEKDKRDFEKMVQDHIQGRFMPI